MRLAALLLLITLATAPGHAAAQELWQGYTAGMSEQAVAAKDRSLIRPAVPDTLSGGARCSLQQARLDIGGMPFSVCFFFLHDRLVQVMIKAMEPSSATLRRTVELLTARYGQPFTRDRSRFGSTTDWLLPSGVNINVTYYEIGAPLLNINYQTRTAEEARKF